MMVIGLYKYKSPSPDHQPYPVNEQQTVDIKLNRPAVMAELIRYFLYKDRKPEESTSPYIIEDALRFLEIIALPKYNMSMEPYSYYITVSWTRASKHPVTRYFQKQG